MTRLLQQVTKRLLYGVLLVAAFFSALFTKNTQDHSVTSMFLLDTPTAHADVTVGCVGDNPGGDGIGGCVGDSAGCTDGDCGTGGADCGGGCGSGG